MEDQEILKYVQLYMQQHQTLETPLPKARTHKQSRKDALIVELKSKIDELE